MKKRNSTIILTLGILIGIIVIIFMLCMIVVIAHNNNQINKCNDLPIGYFKGVQTDFSVLGIDWKTCYIQLDYDNFIKYDEYFSNE